MFGTGTGNLDASTLGEAFSISSGNSLFVAAGLLVDPHEKVHATNIKRTVGNTGHPSLSLLH